MTSAVRNNECLGGGLTDRVPRPAPSTGADAHQTRQVVEEYPMEPSWHLRLLLVAVERDADGDQSERDQHHGGNVELADERNDFGRRRHGVGNDEHVDSEGEEDGDNKRDAFAVVGGQKEGEGC